MSLRVLDPGISSRVVDMGRPASRGLGVPIGGAADRAALMLGNSLAGNTPAAPALEVCLRGPVLRAEARLGAVLFGAPFALGSARQNLTAGTTFTLEAGEELHIGGTSTGMRAYLCVRGGIRAPLVLGSRSGLRDIAAGACLACESAVLPRRFFPPTVLDTLSEGRFELRVLAGLQADWFDKHALHSQEYTVTPALNRMGIRLAGGPLRMPERELVSEPVCPGAVQVTRDGQCIVLGGDGQTIGGYPKIAQVIQADLDHLAQLRPGDKVRFRATELAAASDLFRARRAFIDRWAMRARVSLAGSA